MTIDTGSLMPHRQTAIIDVGSNSFRLIVIEYVPERWWKLVDEIRESVRLAEGMSKDGNLQSAAIERALDTLQMYVAFCRSAGIVDIRTCATAAVRNAKNRDEFLRIVQQRVGLELDVMSDRQEAYYGYLAVVNSMTVENGFIVDLGGGSLEITRVQNREMKDTVSLPFGVVTVKEDYLGDAPTSKDAAKLLQKAIKEKIKALKWFRAEKDGELVLVGQGGTIRNLARIAQKRKNYPLGELQNYFLSKSQISRTRSAMVDKTLDEIKSISGMKEDRADIMMGGATVILAALEASGFKEMQICSQGLREGAFYDRYLYHKSHRRFEDVRRATITNISNLYPYQRAHAEHVAFLSLRIFDQAPPDTMICDSQDRELLWAAGILHDIGASVDYNDHHKHSAYLILNQGLPGYDHRELIMISLLARYHRKGTPSLDDYAKILPEEDALKLEQMSACLRLSEQLERSRDGVVREIKITHEGDTSYMELKLQGDGMVAMWSVLRHAELYEQAFSKSLEIYVKEPHI